MLVRVPLFMKNRRRIVKLLAFGLAVFIAVIGKFLFDLYEIASLPDQNMAAPSDEVGIRLKAHVDALSESIGERNLDHPQSLEAAARYIEKQLGSLGYAVTSTTYAVRHNNQDVLARNIEASLHGESPSAPILILGAHYDTAPGTPGADDNASGVAALIELARELKSRPRKAEIRFVAFSTEEPPSFGTTNMGSAHYSNALPNNRVILGMLSLECLGFYRDTHNSQKYPWPLGWFYPNRGNFIGVVSNVSSRRLLRQFKEAYPKSETSAVFAALPRNLISAITLSDQYWFWERGHAALMITDTAFLRNPMYHQAHDRSSALDYRRFSDVVKAIGIAVGKVSNGI